VVLKGARVDARATAGLRTQMAEARGPVPLFDRGFEDIAELKARCKAETGLEPPGAPQFQSRARSRKVAAGRRA
jgi:N-methylhydantoinase B